MTAIILAIASGFLYGAADFWGGLAARKLALIGVVTLAQCSGFVLLLGCAIVQAPEHVTPNDLLWGMAGGFFTVLGISCLYRALAIGRMSVVAPITAVVAIVVPVLFTMIVGDAPGTLALAGVGLAMVAVVLISQDGGEAENNSATLKTLNLKVLLPALVAGFSFGCFFILLKQPQVGAGLWPLAAARGLSSFLTIAATLVWIHKNPQFEVDRDGAKLGLYAGLGDAGANGLYVLSLTAGGHLAIVATLTSLYPASTILLAAVLLKERLRAIQIFGLLIAAVSVVMIAWPV